MATTRQSKTEDGSLGRDLFYALHYYVGGRRGLPSSRYSPERGPRPAWTAGPGAGSQGN